MNKTLAKFLSIRLEDSAKKSVEDAKVFIGSQPIPTSLKKKNKDK
ncbi:hypothetical protein [Paenibacillus sp. ACRRY]|nr:hypothetical protein [Paenibacillus sp. ACRRY]